MSLKTRWAQISARHFDGAKLWQAVLLCSAMAAPFVAILLKM